MSVADQLTFFDCSIGIFGARSVPEVLTSPEQLTEIFDRYAISGALIYDRGAVEVGIVDDFQRVIGFCTSTPGCRPMIPLVPPACGEQPSPSELVGLIRELGIAAVGVWPRIHDFDLNDYSFGESFEALEAHRIPVVYQTMGREDHPWRHRPDWADLVRIARDHPNLPIIVSPTGMLQGRRALPVLASCPNVHLDLSCHTFRFIEYVVGAFGPDRLLVASRLPYDDPGVMVTHVNYADIDAAARSSIASGTALKLLGVAP